MRQKCIQLVLVFASEMFMLRQIVLRRASSITKCTRNFVSQTNIRANVAEPMAVPPPDGVERPAHPKLLAIVNDIAKLNLLEVSELSALLKKTLNLPDAPMVSYAGGPVAAAPVEDEEEEQKPKVVQSSFKVKLISFAEPKKIALIKELKLKLEDMNLVQAKKFIESAPAYVKEDISREEAEQLKEALEAQGAVIEIL